MAKLTILVFLALFAFAHVATALRATITTTLVEDEDEINPGRPAETCMDQFRTQQQLRHCQMYLRETCRSPSMLLMSMDREEDQQYRQQCCQQLRNLDERCRCKGLQQVVRQELQERKQQQQREHEQQQEEIIIREAEKLPSKCNLRPRTCTISRPRW